MSGCDPSMWFLEQARKQCGKLCDHWCRCRCFAPYRYSARDFCVYRKDFRVSVSRHKHPQLSEYVQRSSLCRMWVSLIDRSQHARQQENQPIQPSTVWKHSEINIALCLSDKVTDSFASWHAATNLGFPSFEPKLHSYRNSQHMETQQCTYPWLLIFSSSSSCICHPAFSTI